jgi:hypothetical protein
MQERLHSPFKHDLLPAGFVVRQVCKGGCSVADELAVSGPGAELWARKEES